MLASRSALEPVPKALSSTPFYGHSTRRPSPGVLTCFWKSPSGKQVLNCDGQVVAGEKEEGAALWKHRTQVTGGAKRSPWPVLWDTGGWREARGQGSCTVQKYLYVWPAQELAPAPWDKVPTAAMHCHFQPKQVTTHPPPLGLVTKAD